MCDVWRKEFLRKDLLCSLISLKYNGCSAHPELFQSNISIHLYESLKTRRQLNHIWMIFVCQELCCFTIMIFPLRMISKGQRKRGLGEEMNSIWGSRSVQLDWFWKWEEVIWDFEEEELLWLDKQCSGWSFVSLIIMTFHSRIIHIGQWKRGLASGQWKRVSEVLDLHQCNLIDCDSEKNIKWFDIW